MSNTLKKANVGDCDCCTRTELVLTPMHNGSMMMCEHCIADEAKITAAVSTIETARKIDASIELKADIFNAATVSFTELAAAIENNPEIPSDRKNYALAEEAARRIDRLNPAIFEAEQAVLKLKNERYMWLENTQKTVAKLRLDQQAKFKQYNVNYKPEAPSKKVKTVTPAGPSRKSFSSSDKAALYAAAKKFNVPAAQVQSIVVSKGLSVEAAAKYLAELLN